MSAPHDPTRGAVTLFIAAITAAAVLVVAGTVFAVIQGQQGTVTSNRQWCTVLDLLTRNPVPKPADPAQNPSRAASWELYEDFVHLSGQFGCR